MIVSTKNILVIDAATAPVVGTDAHAKIKDLSIFYGKVSKIFAEALKLGSEKGIYSLPVKAIELSPFRNAFGKGPFPPLIDDIFAFLPIREKLPVTALEFPYMYLFLDISPRIAKNPSYISSVLGHTFYGLRFGTDALFLSNVVELFTLALRARAPIYVELKSEKGLSRVEKIIQEVEAQERYFDIPVILGHCAMNAKESIRLLKRSNIYGDISLLPLPRLERLIYNLRKALAAEGGYKQWSDKLLFGTAYPLSTPENVARVLAYLFSKRLGATIEDVIKILSLNALKIIEPEVTLGKAKNLDVTRENIVFEKLMKKLSFYHRRGVLIVRHHEPFIDSKYEEGVLTIMSPTTGEFVSFMLHDNSVVALPSMELRKMFTRSVETFMKIPEIREVFSAEETKGTIETVLKEIGIDISTVPFIISRVSNQNPIVSLSPEDAAFLEIKGGEIVRITFKDGSRHHARILRDPSIRPGYMGISTSLAEIWPVSEQATARKIEIDVIPLDRIEIAVLVEGEENIEFPAEIIKPGTILSRNERLVFHHGPQSYIGQVMLTEPHLGRGVVGEITPDTVVSISKTSTLPVNIIIAIDTSGDMSAGEVRISPDIMEKVAIHDPRFSSFMSDTVSRGTAAVVLATLLLEKLVEILPVDKISLLHYDTFAETFRALEETELRSYIQYQGSIDFIMPLATSFFLDKCTLLTGNPEAKPLIETLYSLKEEFDDDNPVILVLLGTGQLAGRAPQFTAVDNVIAIAIDGDPEGYRSVFPSAKTLYLKEINKGIIEEITRLVK